MQHATHDLVKRVNASLQQLSRVTSDGSAGRSPLEVRQQRLQQERLASQFGDVIRQFQRLQQQAASAEKLYVVRARASFASSSTDSPATSVIVGVGQRGSVVEGPSAVRLVCRIRIRIRISSSKWMSSWSNCASGRQRCASWSGTSWT